MKTVYLSLVFWIGLINNTNAQNREKGNFNRISLRELLNESKKNKERNLLSSSIIISDSLDLLIKEKYDLENVNIIKLKLNSGDSILDRKLLHFLKPISNKIIELTYQCMFEYDLTQFTNLKKLNLSYFEKYIDISSLQKIKTVTELSIHFTGVFEINKSSSICFLENVTSITFYNFNYDDKLKIVDYNLITSFPKLEKLKINDYSLSHIPESWSTLTNLKYIDIRCSINDNSLSTLFFLPNWTMIDLMSRGFCPSIDVETFKAEMHKKQLVNPDTYFRLYIEEIRDTFPLKPFFYKEELKQLRYLKRNLESNKECCIVIDDGFYRKHNKIKKDF